MSRSGYSEDCDQRDLAMHRGAVTSAIRGRRGQAFLKDLVAALDAMPVKRLIADRLEKTGEVCAIGSLGRARAMDMSGLDHEDAGVVAARFDIAEPLAREVVYMNDEYGESIFVKPATPGAKGFWRDETPEERHERMLTWAQSQIRQDGAA